jgi:hypothetical protein
MSPRPHRGRRFTNSRRNRTSYDRASDVGTNDADDQRAVLATTDDREDALKGTGTVVADPEYVQFADLAPCAVRRCSNQAVPEAWELVDLDTGDEAPTDSASNTNTPGPPGRTTRQRAPVSSNDELHRSPDVVTGPFSRTSPALAIEISRDFAAPKVPGPLHNR